MEDTNKVPQDIQEDAEKFMRYPKDWYDGDDWAKHDAYIQGRIDERAKQQTPNTDNVEQLAEKWLDNRKVTTSEKTIWIAGYLQRDSQGVELVTFGEWLRDNVIYDGSPKGTYRKTMLRLTMPQIVLEYQKQK